MDRHERGVNDLGETQNSEFFSVHINENIEFYSHRYPKNRVLKVVIKGILTYKTEYEVKSKLIDYGFIVKIMKRFGIQPSPSISV